jgi:NitT/TauT family transport system substrate-binding protein
MTAGKRIWAGVLAWLGAVTALHLTLNVDWSELRNVWKPREQRKLNVAYIPVT